MRCRTVLNTKRPSKPQMTRKTIQWESFGGATANSCRLVESASRSGWCILLPIGRAGRLGDSFIGLHRVGVIDSTRWRLRLVRHGPTFLMPYPCQQQSCCEYAKDQKFIQARLEICQTEERGKILMFDPDNKYQRRAEFLRQRPQ